MATGPTQSAPMSASKRGTIDGELIPFEATVVTTDENSAWFDLGPGLFIGSLVIEITASSDAITFEATLADDVAGNNPESAEKLTIDTGDTGRFEMQFSNQAKVGSTIIAKRAIRFTANTGTAGPVTVLIAYISKAKVN